MGKSRHKKSRKKMRRRRQLKSIQGRAQAHQRVPMESPAAKGVRKKNYAIELSLIALAIGGVILVLSLGPDKKALKDLRESFDSVLYFDSFKWNDLYAEGYKIFALTESDIIETTFDSLPDELNINWKKASFTRIQARESQGVTEQIEIKVDDVFYPPKGVSGASYRAKISPEIGSSAILATWKDLEFSAHIVERQDGVLFCLLGLRKP